MNTSNPTQPNNTTSVAAGIDLSRLKRRPVDLKTVVASRFLFPGWEPLKIKPDASRVVITESEWDAIRDPRDKEIGLDRGEDFSLRVSWSHDVPGSRPCWILRSRKGVFTADWRKQEVWYGSTPKFADIVKSVAQYLLLAHEKYSTDVFHYAGCDTNTKSDWYAFTQRVDNMMAVWKRTPQF